MKFGRQFSAILLLVVATFANRQLMAASATDCPPTRHDEIGPFYRPGAPSRPAIGKGYLLHGSVRTTQGCSPLPGARIDIWQAGPAGEYSDAHRTSLLAAGEGQYQLETDFPPPYEGRPPHIHLLVEAPGFERLITQHYPKPGETEAQFDLVLEPLPSQDATSAPSVAAAPESPSQHPALSSKVVLISAGLLLTVVGLAGSVLPVLPGTPLVLAGLVVVAWAEEFQRVSWPTLLLLAMLTLMAYGVDFLATLLGAKRAGASRYGLAGAMLGTLAGVIFGLPGIIVGPFLGAVAGEYLTRGDLRRAGNVGLGTWLGLVVGSAAKLALVGSMIGVFILGWFL